MILDKPIILYTVNQYTAEYDIRKEYGPIASKIKLGTWYDLVDRLCLKHKIVKMYPVYPIVWDITKILYDLAESIYQIAMKNYPPTNSYTVNNITALYKKFREKESYEQERNIREISKTSKHRRTWNPISNKMCSMRRLNEKPKQKTFGN